MEDGVNTNVNDNTKQLPEYKGFKTLEEFESSFNKWRDKTMLIKEGNPDNLSNEVLAAIEIDKCDNFDSLIEVIIKYAPFKSFSKHDQFTYSADEIIDRIAKFRYNKYSINIITRTSGIRDKVKELQHNYLSNPSEAKFLRNVQQAAINVLKVKDDEDVLDIFARQEFYKKYNSERSKDEIWFYEWFEVKNENTIKIKYTSLTNGVKKDCKFDVKI